jgi:hypothetical protein
MLSSHPELRIVHTYFLNYPSPSLPYPTLFYPFLSSFLPYINSEKMETKLKGEAVIKVEMWIEIFIETEEEVEVVC